LRVAVTGANGRLGRALVDALGSAPFVGTAAPTAWARPAFDLDAPDGFASLLDRDRPEVVVHAAAWTDVDGCARDPELASARNGAATAALAEACVDRGADLVVVSTNEVFDGLRTDGRGYAAGEEPAPANAYGASKREGELGAIAAFRVKGSPEPQPYRGGGGAPTPAGPQLALVRTTWLYGPPGNDFPDKIVAAADRARSAGEPLRVVGDEVGSPTSTADLADAIVELLAAGSFAGIHHIVNAGTASRADWARALLAATGIDVEIVDIRLSDWPRPSTPPRWGVLEPTPTPSGEPLRPWRDAMADDLPWRLRARAAGVR
jgi:dTDP-4-dehydrorhamnose reductase